MPDNPNTDLEFAAGHRRLSNCFLTPYFAFPDLAFILAQNLHGVTNLIEPGGARRGRSISRIRSLP